MKRPVLSCAFLVFGCVLLTMAAPAQAQDRTQALKQGMSVELSGDFAHTQFNAGGGYPNVNGFLGSVGLNILPWLQIQADASEQWGSAFGANTKLYGNHFGPRIFFRPRHSTLTAFGEFLAGGSRLDLTIQGPGGSTYSENGFSFKTGGGVDLQLSRHWAVRAFDADYYRTSFLQTHQNNLWLSTGIVFTFGGGRYPR